MTHLLNPSFEPHRVKYGSTTSINGMEYIQITDIDPTGFQIFINTLMKNVKDGMEKLRNQIKSTRILI